MPSGYNPKTVFGWNQRKGKVDDSVKPSVKLKDARTNGSRPKEMMLSVNQEHQPIFWRMWWGEKIRRQGMRIQEFSLWTKRYSRNKDKLSRTEYVDCRDTNKFIRSHIWHNKCHGLTLANESVWWRWDMWINTVLKHYMRVQHNPTHMCATHTTHTRGQTIKCNWLHYN